MTWFVTMICSTEVPYSSGLVTGEWHLGNVVYTLVVITVCLKAGMELDAWNWVRFTLIKHSKAKHETSVTYKV